MCNGADLLRLWNRAIEDSPLPLQTIARAIGVTPSTLRQMRNGAPGRPVKLETIANSPDEIRVQFLRGWLELEGIAADVAHALRALADAFDPGPAPAVEPEPVPLPLVGEVPATRRRRPAATSGQTWLKEGAQR